MGCCMMSGMCLSLNAPYGARCFLTAGGKVDLTEYAKKS